MDEVNRSGRTLSFPHSFSRNLQLFQNKKPAGRPLNDRVPVMAPPTAYHSLAAARGSSAGWGTAAGSTSAAGLCPAGTPPAAGCTVSFLQREGDMSSFPESNGSSAVPRGMDSFGFPRPSPLLQYLFFSTTIQIILLYWVGQKAPSVFK